MRMCGIWSCRHYDGRPCCTDCADRRCEDRCLNNPGKCGCVKTTFGHRKTGKPAKIPKDEILRLHTEEGLSAPVIARMMGCSSTYVYDVIRKEGKKDGG